MLPALITAKNKNTGEWLVDQRGYIDETKEPAVCCTEKQKPIRLDKFEVKLALVTDNNFQIHTPSTPAQP